MKTGSDYLHIDIETYSSVDLASCGVYKYVESPDFEILLISYCYDEIGENPYVIDLTDRENYDAALEYGLLEDLRNPEVTKVAHNCAFERACLAKFYGYYLPPEQWEDTMIMAAHAGLPQSLASLGEALELGQQKMREGVSLINYFCKPCKPTKANGMRFRNLPEHARDKWALFKEYNRQDVRTEMAIFKRLAKRPVQPAWEKEVFCVDARINETGAPLDVEFCTSAIAIDEVVHRRLTEEMSAITGLENPNSVAQLKSWLESKGCHVESLSKSAIGDVITGTSDHDIERVLQLRSQLGKTSVTKYQTAKEASCDDERVRGITQYYGAGRTGRWAGRLVQMQNLPQNHLDDIELVRFLVDDLQLDSLDLLFDSVPDVLSQLIRTAFKAENGNTLLVADYSAIEARVIAYLAGEEWRLETFRKGGDIYCASASSMFHVPVEKHGINGHLRQKGKVAELACGYGGGVNALKAFGADKMGLSESEMQSIVDQWRTASPNITKFWREVESAAKKALQTPGRSYKLKCGAYYVRDTDALLCYLPSGRYLSYWNARLDDEGSIVFMAQNQTTRKWERSSTWGGKLVENIVQAFARDCLAFAMRRLQMDGWKICFHVHDEIICEEPKDGRTWRDMADIMCRPLPWAPGLPLNADGYATEFYMKD